SRRIVTGACIPATFSEAFTFGSGERITNAMSAATITMMSSSVRATAFRVASLPRLRLNAINYAPRIPERNPLLVLRIVPARITFKPFARLHGQVFKLLKGLVALYGICKEGDNRF